jgi:hypothetical protein
MAAATWLQLWTNADRDDFGDRVGYWLGIYAALATIITLGCFATEW